MDDSDYLVGIFFGCMLGFITVLILLSPGFNGQTDLTKFCMARYGEPSIGVMEGEHHWCFEGIGDSKWVSHDVIRTNNSYTAVGG